MASGAWLSGRGAEMNRAPITREDFLAILEARPEMKRALHAAVAAIIELRREAAKNKTACWLSLN
jgi:hypothetical protein